MEVAPGSKATLSGPMSPGPGYIFFRLLNIVTLIACFACLAQVMSDYSRSGVGTPESIVYMFAVGILGTVWSILILITFLRANNVSFTICFFDFLGMILCIVGVALLTKPAIDECAAAKANSDVNNEISRTNNVDAICGLLRASWGLALANIIFFFLVCIGGIQIATMVADEYRRLGGPVARRTVIEEGYPVQPAVRNVTQTTTASVPIQPGAVLLEKERSSKRHRSSRSADHHRRHSTSRDKRRKSYASGGTRDDYYYPDRKDSRRSSRRDY
ncbi:hypothetical protein H072_10650 [Dactylellina haptotyla CBS 200.50]|uniref:MARVEL domain-containing protein n=1 Tax=Dactylellina haptotyla (strain CBS 200.50) TaxID=1284197 RepID=S8BKW0_DACHA|nr:hypothetical protein H072_10650 [Dactylellina haptotyla CBS 200.50]